MVSGAAWFILNAIWPPPGLGEVDELTFRNSIDFSEPHDEGIAGKKINEEKCSVLVSTSQV